MQIINSKIILKPPSHSTLIKLLLITTLSQIISTFTFAAASINIDNHQVGATTTYTIYLDRQYDDSLLETTWAAHPLESNSTTTVIFPS
jgi:hypothetical protein